METNSPEINEEPVLTADQEKEAVKNELAIISDSDRREIATVAKQEDLLLIASTKKKISNFKRRFPSKNFVITEDLVYTKEVLDKATEQWREVKNWRTKEAEVAIKKLKDPYVKLTKFYNDTFNPLIADVKSIEKPISDYVDRLEFIKKMEDEKEEREKQDRTNNRRDELMKAGAAFDGAYFSISSEEFGVELISLGEVDINSMTDEWFNKAIESIKSAAETISQKQSYKDAETARIAEEKRKEEERRQQEFQQQQDDLKKQQQQLKDANARTRARELKSLGFSLNEDKGIYFSDSISITVTEVESLEMETWEAWVTETEARIEADQKKAKKDKLTESRKLELAQMGLSPHSKGFASRYKEDIVHVSTFTIESYSEKEWENMVKEIGVTLLQMDHRLLNDQLEEARKKDLRSVRESQLAPYWQFVTGIENATLADLDDVEFVNMLADKKTVSDKKIADDLATQKEAKDKADKTALSAQGDQAMFDDYVSKLRLIELPKVSTEPYKIKVSKIQSFLSSL